MTHGTENIPSITELLHLAMQKTASDLHLSAGIKPMVRVDGDMQTLPLPVLTAETLRDMIEELLQPQQLDTLKTQWELDFAWEVPQLSRFRVNVFNQKRGLAAVFRAIPSHIPTLEALKVPTVFYDLIQMHKGLILVTGPTGSGKSTTLAAMIHEINRTQPVHILTVEDPIEFVHTSQKALVNQRELHSHTADFSTALRSALREDPDVVLVGELRDLETIRLALTAAETGHLVFATLHTSSAAKTVDRIIDVFPGNEKAMVRSMLSESLQAVIAQSLIKRQGGGRVAVHEIMICTSAIRNLIREDKVAQMYSAIQTGAQVGMQTVDQSLLGWVKQGAITRSDAREFAQNKELFK